MVDDDAASKARVGTVLCGKWTLERLLGVGGMAAVYAARHKIGRLDAVKILHPHVARSADSRARFEQEAHAVNRLGHPGAVEIRDLDVTDEGTPFIVMELLDGEPLAEIFKRSGGLAPDAVLRHADDVLDVLAAAHAHGIVHRDIKPDNIFLLRDGRLKVLDFGIARMRDGGPSVLQTRTGATLGTLGYMPPEQITGRSNLDARADIFALGATMFRLIANRRVHDARSEQELLVKMATQPAPPLASVVPAAPQAVCLVVDRALGFQREQRYPDARTMQSDVRAARRGETPPYAARLLALGNTPQAGPAGAGAPAAAAPPVAQAPVAQAPASGPQPSQRGTGTVLLDTPYAASPHPPAAAAASALGTAATMLADAPASQHMAAAVAANARAAQELARDERLSIVAQIIGCVSFVLLLGCAVGMACAGGPPGGDAADRAAPEDESGAIEVPGRGKARGRKKDSKHED